MASPDEVNAFHQASDVDRSWNAQHHTLGLKANQAAPGPKVLDHEIRIEALEAGGGGGGSSTLKGLSDVSASSPADGDLLRFNAATQKWESYTFTPPVANNRIFGISPGCSQGAVASTSAYAFKGEGYLMASDVLVHRVGAVYSTAIGDRVQAVLIKKGSGDIVGEIYKSTPLATPPGTPGYSQIWWFDFDTPVAMLEGETWFVCAGNIDQSGTTPFSIRSVSGSSLPYPSLPAMTVNGARIANSSPSVGTALERNAGTIASVGIAVEYELL